MEHAIISKMVCKIALKSVFIDLGYDEPRIKMLFIFPIYNSLEGEPYDIPLTKVQENPLDAIYQYPIKGNKLKLNGTHFFLPTFQKLYSKFYIHFPFENQKLYGFSQQLFDKQNTQILFKDINATLLANDHIAIVKAEGDWKNHVASSSIPKKGYVTGDDTKSEDIPFGAAESTQLTARLYSLLQWFEPLGNYKLVDQFHLKNQVPLLKEMSYSQEYSTLGDKLRDEMKSYSSNIGNKQYHDFAKSGMMCLHLNLEGFPYTMEEGTLGVWLPLNRNLVFWRSMFMFEPLQKLMTVVGVVSIHVSQDNLEMVYKGTQLFRTDVEGIDYKNLELYVGPPYDIQDTRPTPPPKPNGIAANTARNQIESIGSNIRTPWAPRKKLCPAHQFDQKFERLKNECPQYFTEPKPFNMTLCLDALAKAYPCFNYFLRSSEKFSHGIDGLSEVLVIIHMFREATWEFMKAAAIDEPWDDEMEIALEKLGLQDPMVKPAPGKLDK